VVDIVDAWPETFLRLIPGEGRVREGAARLLLKPMFAQAARAYREADGISSVARTFLDLPARAGSQAPVHLTYLGGEIGKEGENVRPTSNVQRPEKERKEEDGVEDFGSKEGSESSSESRPARKIDEGGASSLHERREAR